MNLVHVEKQVLGGGFRHWTIVTHCFSALSPVSHPGQMCHIYTFLKTTVDGASGRPHGWSVGLLEAGSF
jgi:hypothetical protein